MMLYGGLSIKKTEVMFCKSIIISVLTYLAEIAEIMEICQIFETVVSST